MKEAKRQLAKKCPVCQKEYPEEDNYCGDDGSALELETRKENLDYNG
jgi:predicted nucleic acid-binding Zn ribbon protein